jgi:hypothetical protein
MHRLETKIEKEVEMLNQLHENQRIGLIGIMCLHSVTDAVGSIGDEGLYRADIV